MKRWISALSMVVLLLAPVAAYAQSSPGALAQERGERGMHKMDRLGLSPQQKDQIHALREQEKQMNGPLMDPSKGFTYPS
jgi:Spy/CpxP family protein refolding chaperone